MKKIILVGLFLMVTSLSGMRTHHQLTSHYFALRIHPQGPHLVTTAVVTVQDDKIIQQEIISREQFVLMMSGVYYSKANPKSNDVFKLNNIFTCESVIDTLTRKLVTIKCPLLDDIWKVRYRIDIRKKNYHYGQAAASEGWAATDFFPSKSQFVFLKDTYGADGCNEFIWGDNLMKFMKDVQDTAWINKYKALN